VNKEVQTVNKEIWTVHKNIQTVNKEVQTKQKMYPDGCTNDLVRYNKGLTKILKDPVSKERGGCMQERILIYKIGKETASLLHASMTNNTFVTLECI